MEYIKQSKLLYHMDRVTDSKKPITADIFLTNFCNHKCGYCRYNHEYGEYMKFEDFKKYVNRLMELGVEGIILTGGGEPTLNRDFDKIVEWLEDNNISYGINSNFNVYRDMNPAYLKVSIDAIDEEEYELKRKSKLYNKMIEHIKRFRRDHDKSVLGIQMVVDDINKIELFYEKHKDLDVDYMSFRPIEAKDKIYSDDEVKNIIEVLEGLRKKDKRVLVNYKWLEVNRCFRRCKANWSVISIRWDGEVMYCCNKPDEIVGNIMDEDILEKKEKYRTDMRLCEKPCRLTGSNVFLEGLEGGVHSEFV